jgi:hypothetical protein
VHKLVAHDSIDAAKQQRDGQDEGDKGQEDGTAQFEQLSRAREEALVVCELGVRGGKTRIAWDRSQSEVTGTHPRCHSTAMGWGGRLVVRVAAGMHRRNHCWCSMGAYVWGCYTSVLRC